MVNLFPSTERLRKITINGKDIILADYSGLKQEEMIALTEKHTAWVLAEAKESYFIANYVNTYGSPEYMKAAYEFTQATKPFIPKGAFLGITGAKIGLLKAITFFMKANFRACDDEEEAIRFLVD